MRTAYLDCIGGISGDMMLGALIDAGVDVERLVEGLRTLDLPPWELEVGRTRKSGIAAATAEVVVRGEAAGAAPLLRDPPSDQPLSEARGERREATDQPPGHEHSHSHENVHEHGYSYSYQTHTHSHEHEHDPNAPSHPQTHTPTHPHSGSHTHTPTHPHSVSHTHTPTHPHTGAFEGIVSLIRKSGLPEPVKERAEAVYRRLAEAEAAVHGVSLERVHFHEVGAVDSVVDVVGSVLGLHMLGVERVVCSPLPTGKGFVRCAHGLMPVPPPATAELLKGCPLRQVDVEGELVTPTGAALASALASAFGPLPGFTLRETGYGAGKKDFPFPNLLRILIGEDTAVPEAAEVLVVEANIDDQSPQLYEGVVAALLEAGALDVWLTPIQMKKGRPAQVLSLLCEPGNLEALARVLFTETTTLGVRYAGWQRLCLEREWIEVETEFGSVRVKVGRQGGELRTATPEYEDCRRRASESGAPVKLVQAAAAAAAWDRLRREIPPGKKAT